MNYDIFQRVFGGIGGRVRDFVPMVKLFMPALGFENIASERSFYPIPTALTIQKGNVQDRLKQKNLHILLPAVAC